MAEDFSISESGSREEKYQTLLSQIPGLVSGESDLTANLANITAALHQTFGFLWVGFYLVKNNELVLGPFQGPVACTRINYGKGVCGKAWEQRTVLVVPDVDQFPGHIACSSKSRSEIVIPGFNKNEVALVLDIDSEQPGEFDATDAHHLSQLMKIIESLL
jgi:L-methionine (R)-S-oxide reductase